VDIDDKDLHIDMSGGDNDNTREQEEASIKTDVESTLKQKSQQNVNEVAKTNDKKKKNTPPKKSKKKRNGNAAGEEGKRRTTKLNSSEEVVVIEKPLPTPPPWVTTDPSITADISLEQRQLIEFYVNPLEELPQEIDIR
jgi:hypothetical protein